VNKQVEIAARDGCRLAGVLFRPQQPNNRAILINAAVGVPQAYYGKFAAYLAEQGFSVLTYDYRGIGRSRHAPLREMRTGMADWARLDAAGALDFLERAAPGARISVVGHSFGGQCVGIIPGNERIRALYTVGSQSGYWGNWRGKGRAGMWFLTHLVIPVLAGALGYLPGARLGMGEDMPGVAAREWASWCRHPGYLVGALGVQDAYARITIPLHACCITDDGYAPLATVEAFIAQHPNADSELQQIAPRDAGAKRIGHFGFFREQFRDTLWRDAAGWLQTR
jgi:predicted alpha/beta hydrolase